MVEEVQRGIEDLGLLVQQYRSLSSLGRKVKLILHI
jgi:hypothetical protein